jgi:hypothetical protein
MSQIIIYDDISFYQCANGYYSNGRAQRLHRYKWEKEKGPILPGYHIHHKDENKDNNELDNYEMLPGKEHLSLHGKSPEHIKTLLKYGEMGRKLAEEWHHSKEASEFSKQNWPNSLGLHMNKKIIKQCEHCGKDFETIEMFTNHDKWCGNNCKSKARRASGIDNITKTCVVCGKEFLGNKYEKTQTCSRKCGSELSRIKRTGVKQPSRRVVSHG